MSKWPDGFIANMRWYFEGRTIEPKLWRSFRTKFAKTHAKGWRVSKAESGWPERNRRTHVTFRTTDPDVAREMTAEQWELLKITLQLLMVQNAS